MRKSNPLRILYTQLFKINDSPRRIALGFGLGVFCGILPGTGALASLFLALVFKANRAAALTGSLLTNTWLSIASFLLSIKIGSVIMKVNWQDIQNEWSSIMQDFHWPDLLKFPVLKIVLPVAIGYIILSAVMGAAAYLVALSLTKKKINNSLS